MKVRNIRVVIIALAALVAGALVAYVTLIRQPVREQFDATDITGVDWGRNFQLTGDDGQARELVDFRGKVVAMYFGDTHCADMCPITLANLAQAIKRLGNGAPSVQVLFVTVDPKRDTQAALRQYVRAFDSRFVGLYGDAGATQRTADEFKVYFHLQPPNPSGDYEVDHSGQIFVFDPKGRLRLAIRPEAEPTSIAHDLRILLNEAA